MGEKEETYVLLWSKYSSDHGMYPYHIEELDKYLASCHRMHNSYPDTHDNLWIPLAIDTPTNLFGLFIQMFKENLTVGVEDDI